MRYFLTLLAAIVALAGAPSLAATSTATTYHVVYGTKDLGLWTSMAIGKQSGTYTSTTFDSSNGAGFATISLTRTKRADDPGLAASLPAPNVKLVVTTLRNGKAISASTCAMSNAFSTGMQGDPGTGTTNIEFACMAIATKKV